MLIRTILDLDDLSPFCMPTSSKTQKFKYHECMNATLLKRQRPPPSINTLTMPPSKCLFQCTLLHPASTAYPSKAFPYYFPALLRMELLLQSIENNKNKRRARRTPRNSNSTATVQSLQAILSPNSHPLSPEHFLRAIGMYG